MDGNLVGEGDFAEQAKQIARNLDIALASAGATRDDLIKQTIFVVDYRPEIAPLIMGPLHTGTRRCAESSLVDIQALFALATSLRSRPWPVSPWLYLARAAHLSGPRARQYAGAGILTIR